MKKKVFLMMMAALLTFSMTACGSDNSSPDEADTSKQPEQAEQSDQTDQSKPADSGTEVTKDVYKRQFLDSDVNAALALA